MDLKLFLDPVDSRILSESARNSTMQKSIFINQESIPDLEGIDMVILGLTDHRDVTGQIEPKAAELIRKNFYGLQKTSGRNRVADLGNLRNGPTATDTRLRLQEVMSYIMEKGIIPILIGGTQDMILGHYYGYEGLDKLITLLNIDASLDLDEDKNPSQSYIGSIFRHNPNYLFNFIQLGYQTYLVAEKDLAMLERLSFEAYRLGQFRDNFKAIEPVLREADMISFDLSSIQSIYCPETTQTNVFGFTGEEACQMSWYAGLNDKLSSFGLYNYVPGDIPDPRTPMVIATMLWYFVDGYYHRKGDRNFMSNDYLVYEVAIGGEPDTIRFYKSKLSEKWWMEIPDQSSDSIFLRNKMIPCNYSDYEIALEGEIPQRWITALAKIT